MVLEKAKIAIAGVFVSHLKKFGNGIEVQFKVEDYLDDCCFVEIPAVMDVLGDDFFDRMISDLKSLPEVKNTFDTGRTWNNDKLTISRQIEIDVNDGCWEHTKDDDKRSEQIVRRYSDPAYAKECEEKERLAKLEHWKDFLLPIPTAPKTGTDEVYLVMAYQPYDWIKKGEKTTEFRTYNEYYAKRLLSNPVKRIRFQRGYGGPNRPLPEQMVWEVKRIDLYDITTRTWTDPFNPTPIIPTHFAIELGRRIE